MEYILYVLLFAMGVIGVLLWDYIQVKDTPEFQDVVKEIEREDILKSYHKK